MVIYADQLEVMLKRHSFVNEICQDKEGLEAYRVFLTFKKAIETKLEDLENLLRQQILRNLNAQNLNEEAEKFIKEAGDFAMNDLLILRKRILERMQNLQQNTVVIKEAPQRKELLQLTAYLKDKIPNLQREILNHLEATYTTFELGKEIVVPRLSKVLIGKAQEYARPRGPGPAGELQQQDHARDEIHAEGQAGVPRRPAPAGDVPREPQFDKL